MSQPPSKPSARPAFLRRSLLKPRDVLPHIHDITPEFLAERGLYGLLLDLDNTMIPYGSYEERADVMLWAANLRRGGIRLYMLSNATGKRARFWMDKLGFEGAEGVGMAGKPHPRAYRVALAQMQLPAHQVGMVGDQLFTDVLGGNLNGMHTILVHPLGSNSLPHTRVARTLERAVLKRYGHDWKA